MSASFRRLYALLRTALAAVVVVGLVAFISTPSFAAPPVPGVVSVSPNVGIAAGGGTVTITGTGFTGVTQVAFGVTPATNLVVVSPTQLTATVPSHAAGLVDVQVSTALGTSPVVSADHYTFEPVPAIAAVTPNIGILAGGSTVTVTGSGFLGISAVNFGSTPATSFAVTSSTTLTAVVPAEAAGVTDVQLVGTYGTSPAVTADHYTFEDIPAIAGLSPPVGVVGGGGSVVITGTNFVGITKVLFGTVAGTALVVNSPTQLTVTPPAHVAADVSVQVVGNFGSSIVPVTPTSPSEYTYGPIPTVTSVSLAQGVLSGANTVTVTGTGFVSADAGSTSMVTGVLFGTIGGTSITVNSSTSLTVTAPSHAVGLVDVRVVAGNGTSAVIAGDHYTYEPVPVVTAVTPALGALAGANTVTVTGSGFIAPATVTVAGTPATNVIVVSPTTLTFVAPAGTAAIDDVVVTTLYGTSVSVPADHYTYEGLPTIASVSPSVGVITGGQSVTLTGTNFVGITKVTFGGVAGTALVVASPTQLTVTTPAHVVGSADVSVVGNYGTVTLTGGYTYGAAPTITSLSSSQGVLAGGGNVVINGTGFATTVGAPLPLVTAVLFGTTPATNVSVSNSGQLTATIPSHIAGLVDVRVVVGNGTSAITVADHYTYQPIPAITAVTPAAGIVAGGNVITVTGSGFVSSALLTSVTVGGVAATFSLLSATSLSVTVPAGTVGPPADVQVTTQFGTSLLVAADHYTYEPVPAVSGVTPAAGVLGGTNIVTVTGSGFVGITKVNFGATASAKVVVVSPTQLTVTVPAHVAGTVDVQVFGPYGTSPTSVADDYTYQPVPVVTSVAPNAGVLSVGTTVTITGANFLNVTAVNFGTTPGTNLVVTPTQITVTAPAHVAGIVDVVVVGAYGASVAVAADKYTFEPVPAVTAVTPNAGILAGGNTVTVTGSGFVGITGVTVGGAAATSFTVVSTTSITFVAPAAAAGATAVQIVGLYGTSPLVAVDTYTYQPVPAITSVTLNAGVLGGANIVTVAGTGFIGITKVNFGATASAKVVIVSPTQLTVTVPAHVAGTVDVQAFGPYGTSPTSAADLYTYQPVPTVASVSPGAGALAGSSTVTINGSGFFNVSKVTFGTTLATNVVTVSPTQLTATVPAHIAGVVDVQVVTAYGTSLAVATDKYTYQSAASISGVVSGAGTPTVLLSGVEVSAYDATGVFAGSTYTSATGAYTLAGLGTGSYTLDFAPSDTSYAPQWFTGALSEITATPIVIVAGQALTGKSIVLTRGATISGNVSGDGSANLTDVAVSAYDASGNFVGGADTDASGNYSISGLAAGSYSLDFAPEFGSNDANVYAPQWFDDESSEATADPITVTAGQSLGGMDAELFDGSEISGTVTDESATAVSEVGVAAYDSTGTWVAGTVTDANGNYALFGLADGTYAVKFSPSGAYAPQWYDGEASEATADPITVGGGSGSFFGADATLADGGAIAGTITGPADAAVDGVEVDAYDADGNWVGGTQSDGSGHYVVTGLAAGFYTLDFTPTSGNYAAQWWNDAPTQAEATPLEVTEGNYDLGEDVSLTANGSISGNVFGSGTSLVTLTDVSVFAFDAAGNQVESVATDANGYYSLGGLPAGSYTLEFVANGSQFGTQWFSGKTSQLTATVISLGAGQNITGDNVTLTGTSISGTVMGAGSPNVALSGVKVIAVDAAGNGVAEADSNSIGAYSIGGIPAGSYTLEFVPKFGDNYATQWWTGQPTQATATYIAVTTGVAVTGKNAVLASALGSISGAVTVNDINGPFDPVVFAEVDVFDSAGNFVSLDDTDENGDYTISGLPAGSYKVFASSESWGNQYANQWWANGVTTATQATATPVVLTVAGTRTVNFSLAQNSTISGTVFGADTPGVGVAGVEVDAEDAAGDFEGFALTAADGTYTIDGLVPGTYFLVFGPDGMPDSTVGAGLPYAEQWYSGKTTEATATPIVVGNQIQLVGKNVTLAVGATITGHVSYIPLDGVEVDATSTAGNEAFATTDSNGNYTLAGLLPGTYTLDFDPQIDVEGNVDWWYNATSSVGAQLTVTLTGTTVTAPPVSLVVGASISGTVYGAGTPNVPLADIDVTAFDASGEEIGFATTADDGTYTIPVPATGAYTLDFSNDPNPSDGVSIYVGEWLGGQTTEAAATPVQVTAGQSVSGEDIVLPLGATISGTIEGAGTPNVPLQSAEVDAYDTGGNQVEYALTDASGNYTLTDLPAGSYTLDFLQNEPYAGQWSGDQATEQAATVIPVTNGQTVTGEDAVLAVGGSISGSVVGAASPNVALPEWQASAYDASGNLIGTGTTDNSGNYTIDSLPDGTYSVGFTDLASDDSLDATYSAQWYKGQPSEATATPITVSGGNAVTGKNVVLVPGGTISGYLYTAGNVPASGAVNAYDAYGALAGVGGSSSTGRYEIDSLPPGSYTLEFIPNGAGLAVQWWKGQPSQATSTTVTVLSRQTSSGKTIVFGTGASISGTVTDIHGLKLNGIKIPIWQLEGSTYVEQAPLETRTDGNGKYTLSELPAGTYKIGFEDYATGDSMPNTVFSPDFWNNAPTLGAATPITVTATQVVTGVSGVLTKIGALATLTAHPTPTITGTAKVGSVLTAVPGTWAPAPVVLTYQWLDSGNPIVGATSSTYTPTGANLGDKISVIVTGQKVGYNTLPSSPSLQTANVTS